MSLLTTSFSLFLFLLLLMWPGLESCTWYQKWVEFVALLKGLFSRFSTKINMLKLQFDQQRTSLFDVPPLIFMYLFIYLFIYLSQPLLLFFIL